MVSWLSGIFMLWLTALPVISPKTHVQRKEAKQAFHYINAFRANPEKYVTELGLSGLSGVTSTPLKWNRTLARIAEQRAIDMARRDYFDHVDPDGYGPNYHIHTGGYALNPDWVKNRRTNNFESIGANHSSALEGVQAFIIGKGSPGFMHRKHLLGMDDWNGSLEDIGIGFVRVPKGARYKSYLCVLIAKHDW